MLCLCSLVTLSQSSELKSVVFFLSSTQPFFLLLPPLHALSSLIFWPSYLYVSQALQRISITFSFSCPVPLSFLSCCTASPWELYSPLVHASSYSFCSPIYLFLPLTNHHPLLPFFPTPLSSAFQQPKLVSSIYCAEFYGLVVSRPQQPCNNGHQTHSNSSLKEIYRAITQRLPHWRFTTAKSTGLNTPSKSTIWQPFPLVCICCALCVCVKCWQMCVWRRGNTSVRACILKQECLYVCVKWCYICVHIQGPTQNCPSSMNYITALTAKTQSYSFSVSLTSLSFL